MFNLIKRILWMIITCVVLKWKFGKLEFGSLIIRPLKINNSKSIFIEKNVIVNDLAWLMAINKQSIIKISEGSRIGHFSHIVSLKEIDIGKKVLIADKVYISDNVHSYEDIQSAIKDQPVRFSGKVKIGDNSWIGEGVSIIGAEIGRNCIVGANSVVTKDIPNYCVAVGAPAIIIKRYDFQSKMWKKTNKEGEFI